MEAHDPQPMTHVSYNDTHSIECARCGVGLVPVGGGWRHRLAPAECGHPVDAQVGHADNPSRYSCALCGTRFADYGKGYQEA